MATAKKKPVETEGKQRDTSGVTGPTVVVGPLETDRQWERDQRDVERSEADKRFAYKREQGQ